jgi:3-oxoacyl-[acyl-carrier protein] reductase
MSRGVPNNIFITGGSRGLGRGFAQEFARSGWNVAFTYVSREESAKAVLGELSEINPDGTFRMYKMNVADSDDVERVGNQVLDDFGDIRALINNAGVNHNNALALMTDEQWASVIATNLSGPFYVSRFFITHFLTNRLGRIINIGSIANDGTTGQANYSAAKAGLKGLTRSIAKEYGPKGITANLVVPGIFETDMVKENLSKQMEDFWLKFCPTRRLGQLNELTRLVVFLCGDDAAYINGATIDVTAGLTYSP